MAKPSRNDGSVESHPHFIKAPSGASVKIDFVSALGSADIELAEDCALLGRYAHTKQLLVRRGGKDVVVSSAREVSLL